MHRATPANSSFRAYSGGGARSTVDKVDSSKLMQEMGGNMMNNESRSKVEAPQNYGFSSVPHSADKGEDGKISGGAECQMSFMGGNRSFPVAGAIDDRRHRMKGMAEGDVALFRGKGDSQQFHMNGKGGFWSGGSDKTLRMQLVPQGSSDPGGGEQGGGGGGQQGGQGNGKQQNGGKNKPTGQSPVYGKGDDSKEFMHLKGSDATLSHGKKVSLSNGKDDDDVTHQVKEKKDYCGGTPDKHKFSKVLTLAGPAVNVFGKIG